MTYFEECISIWPAVGARWRTKPNRSQTPTPRPHPGGAGSVWSHPSSATSPPTVFPAHIHNRCRQAAARPRPHDVVVRLDFGRPGCGEAAIVHCENVFDRDQCFNPYHTYSVRLLRRDPGLGAKRWQRQLTIGNGLKSASNGRAKPLMRPCASNTPALAEFGLSRLRGLSGLAHSRRQNQK